jgi:hypothetical protein
MYICIITGISSSSVFLLSEFLYLNLSFSDLVLRPKKRGLGGVFGGDNVLLCVNFLGQFVSQGRTPGNTRSCHETDSIISFFIYGYCFKSYHHWTQHIESLFPWARLCPKPFMFI